MQYLGVCLLLLFPHSLLVVLTQDMAGAGTAVLFEDLMERKEVLDAVWNWEPGQFASVAV